MKHEAWNMEHIAIVRGKRVYANIVKRVLRRACEVVRCPRGVEVSLIFVSDARMRKLNRAYRGKDRTTNVLAFEGGDIFISLPEARREAKRYGWSLRYNVVRLALHGFLHLVGYDHVKAKDTREMERIESKILTSTKSG